MENQIAPARKLTVIRRKALASIFDKNWFYIEDAHGDVEISCIKCKLLGVLKNGGTGTYEIGSGALKLIAVSGDGKGIYSEHGFAVDICVLPDNSQDVTVSGKRYADFAQANRFIFDR